MFCAHTSWANYMIDECLLKKKITLKEYKDFGNKNHYFFGKAIVNLIKHVDDLDLKGTLLALANGSVAYLKFKDMMGLMHEFSIKGVKALDREKESLGDDFINTCLRFYQTAKLYCQTLEE